MALDALPFPKITSLLDSERNWEWLKENILEALTGSGGSSLVPVGTLLPFAGSAAASGFLLCSGTAVSRTTYSDLNSLLSAAGYPYGTGDGSTTFNLPDLRGRVIVMVDGAAARMGSNDTLGAVDGAETVTLAEANLASHTHGAGTLANGNESSHTHSADGTLATDTHAGHGHGISGVTGNAGGHNHSATYSTATNTQTGGTATRAVAVAGTGLANAWNTQNEPVHSHGAGTFAADTAGSHSHDVTGNTSAGSAHTHSVSGSTGSSGSGTAFNKMPPYQVLNYMIKY